MYYKTEKRKRRPGKIIAAAFVLLVITAIVAGAFYLFSEKSLSSKVIELPGVAGRVFPYQDGVLCIESRQLTCYDLQGKTLYQAVLPADDMSAERYGDLTVAWGGNILCVLDPTGYGLLVKEMPGNVLMARAGKGQFVVVTQEEGQDRLRVISSTGTDVDEERFPYQTVVAADFYGTDMSQLWVMVVDSHGTIPISRVNTYNPGKSTTPTVTVTDQIGYAAAIPDKRIYFVGTHNISVWENTGDLRSEYSIYGWNMEDMLATADKNMAFLLVPANSSQYIGSLWYIPPSGAEAPISLPSGCIGAAIGAKRLSAITRTGVYSYAFNGKGQRFDELSFNIDEVMGTIPGKAFIARSGHKMYIVPIT